MMIFPKKNVVKKLAKIFDKFADKEFPSLREQLDTDFDNRYKVFWLEMRKGQKTFFSLDQQVNPSEIRLNLDLSVCKALNIPTSKEELKNVYGTIVKEMIVTRGLTRD
ncbi:MAG TPA: hypothetical protein ENI51_03265 [Candidatus Atribacteria bacterium]|nr:hypothetical protein [Candidatus Atribacteria bacterium]